MAAFLVISRETSLAPKRRKVAVEGHNPGEVSSAVRAMPGGPNIDRVSSGLYGRFLDDGREGEGQVSAEEVAVAAWDAGDGVVNPAGWDLGVWRCERQWLGA